jgi:hypothetical protein
MIRFNHEANSWQVRFYNHIYFKPYEWINISPSAARAYYDTGYGID